jgi:rSAM/selenodomain-associated transferase 1
MAKAPVPGLTKTRLNLPPEDAARLGAALARDAISKAHRLGPTTVAGEPPDRLDLLAPLLPRGVRLIPQAPGDLGQKMLAAARALFAESDVPVVILGTDAPTLPVASICKAAEALAGKEPHDVSIVGSEDGGYVLLGLRRPHEALFRGIAWSTPAVYEESLVAARGAGLKVHEGELHRDLDTPEDLVWLRRELRSDPTLAPRTAQALRHI